LEGVSDTTCIRMGVGEKSAFAVLSWRTTKVNTCVNILKRKFVAFKYTATTQSELCQLTFLKCKIFFSMVFDRMV
jgi:hypothetical protein